MNINMNSPNNERSFTLYTIETHKDTKVLKELKGNKLTEALAKVTNDQALPNIAIRKGDIFLLSEEAILSDKKFVVFEDGKKIDLSGRVRVMNEADVAEIKQFAANYFARMKEGEEKVIVKAGIHAKISQPAKESDKKISNAAKKGIETANERAEEERGKENRTLEIKGNLETGKKIRRFYEEMKSKSAQIAEFQKETRENKIN